MATNGTIYSGTPNSSSSVYGAKWKFVWTATPTDDPGVTKVTWDAYTSGRESASSNTSAYARLYVFVYDYAGGTIVEGNGKQIGSYNSGTGTIVSFKNVWRMGGSFHVKHSTDGTGGFKITLDANIAGYDTDGSGTGVLNENVPYYYVYIHNGSENKKAVAYIDTGTEWKATRAYISNGTSWKTCT
jgi:hypothetical protein